MRLFVERIDKGFDFFQDFGFVGDGSEGFLKLRGDIFTSPHRIFFLLIEPDISKGFEGQ